MTPSGVIERKCGLLIDPRTVWQSVLETGFVDAGGLRQGVWMSAGFKVRGSDGKMNVLQVEEENAQECG